MRKGSVFIFCGALAVSAGGLLAGCAHKPLPLPAYIGAGTYQDFMKTRYECVKEAQNHVSGFGFNAFGNAASGYHRSGDVTDCIIFSNCLAAKGYYPAETEKANFTVPGNVVVQCGKRQTM